MSFLKIVNGIDTFRGIRENNLCYIDKSMLLSEFLNNIPQQVSLITRPRRFGKTLALDMMYEFFDITKDSIALFKDLEIYKDASLCNAWMNKYPTIFISFQDIEGDSYSECVRQYADIIGRLISDMAYLYESQHVRQRYKEILSKLESNSFDTVYLQKALLYLSNALEEHWGKQVILLIDEYDIPLLNASELSFYPELMKFFRGVIRSACKGNNSLKFAVMTGALRISKESIFTGANNFTCYSINDVEFSDKFGFTDNEVNSLLRDADLLDKKALLKEWYDGYIFGSNTEIYCPWDILQYIRSAQIDNNATPKTYWNNTSGNIIVKHIVEKSNYDTQTKLETLLDDKTITIELAEDLTYDSLYDNDDSLWTVLYLSGYLTKSSLQPTDGRLSLTIPNKEIKKIFIKTIKTWFEKAIKKEDLSVFLKALWNGDAETLQNELTRILYETISYYDSAENFYHGFMAGIFAGAGLLVDSNKESGKGRPDLIVIDGPGRRAAVIELKHAADPRQLEALAEQAFRETQTLSYAKGRIARLKSVLCYGIAFCRKDCAVSLHS